jgi:histidinol-phosphate aminotransferase
MTLFRTAKPNLASVKSYVPGKPLEELEREYGIKDAVKMASNENALGPSPKAVAAMKKNLSRVHRYPEGGCHYLRQKLVKSLGVEPDELVFGNGSDELLVFAVRAFVGAGDEVVTADPTFLIYEIASTAENARVVKVPMDDFRYDLSAMLAKITDKTKLVFIANPDNPVGTYINFKRLTQFLERVPRGVLVVLDEAYHEFARVKKDYPDSLKLRKHFKNLIITRTFSKAYGLAGLRVGYAVTEPSIAEALNKVREPFNVNSLAQAAAVAALDDRAFLKRSVDAVNQGRSFLSSELTGLGFRVIETVTNFILFDLGQDAAPVYESLLKQGVIVRPMGSWGLKTFLRVTIGKAADNRRFLRALKSATAALFLALLLPAAAFADVILHKNGQAIEGVIVSETEAEVTIAVEGMDLPVPRADITSITRGKVQKKAKKVVPAKPAPAPAPQASAPARQGIDIARLEKPVLVFDDRKWKLDFQDARNSQVIAEFVLEGESVKDWSELVTAQLFIGLRSDPRYFVDYVKKQTASRCANTEWRTLRESPQDILYEWNVKDCEGVPDQSEIARVYLGADGLHVLHYAVKLGEMPEENHAKWIQNLEAVQFVKP